MEAVMNSAETVFQKGLLKTGITGESDFCGKRSAEAWKVEVVESFSPVSSLSVLPDAKSVSVT